MKRFWWRLAEGFSRALDPDERDAVCGDLLEAGGSGPGAVLEILGLVLRRQAGLWKGWRPWFALLAIAAPLGLLFSVASLRTASSSAVPIWMYVDNWTFAHLESPGGRELLLQTATGLVKGFAVLACTAWAAGLLLGWAARRTAVVQGGVLCVAVLCAAALMPGPDWPRAGGDASPISHLAFYVFALPVLLQLALVVGPAILGIREGAVVRALPFRLRALAGAAALASVLLFAWQNWGWVWCWTGETWACLESAVRMGNVRGAGGPVVQPLPALPFALAAPALYTLASALRPRRSRALQPPA